MRFRKCSSCVSRHNKQQRSSNLFTLRAHHDPAHKVHHTSDESSNDPCAPDATIHHERQPTLRGPSFTLCGLVHPFCFLFFFSFYMVSSLFFCYLLDGFCFLSFLISSFFAMFHILPSWSWGCLFFLPSRTVGRPFPCGVEVGPFFSGLAFPSRGWGWPFLLGVGVGLPFQVRRGRPGSAQKGREGEGQHPRKERPTHTPRKEGS